MSRDDTARITSGCDGKRCSIFLDCPNPGSLVEKKKFSSTTGLRSTKTATSTNKTTVKASISQCAPGSFFQFGSRTFIDRKLRNYIGGERRSPCNAGGQNQTTSTGHLGSACLNARP